MAGDLIEDERFQDQQFIKDSTSHIADLLEAFFASIDAEEAYRGAQERGFAFGPVRTMDDIVQDGHWEDRGFFVTVEHPELGKSFVYPGAPAIYSATPWKLSRRAPTLGEHNAEVFAELAGGPAGPAAVASTGAS
jgi:crotonobetainyl-CoA:carnitine CoA-transferase CaiB-like acyl-CoA transferase